MYLGQLYRKVVKPQQMSVIMSKHICVNRYAMSLTYAPSSHAFIS